MKSRNTIIVALLTLVVMAVLIIVSGKPQTTPESPPTPNPLTQDTEFVNTKYMYQVAYSSIFDISTQTPVRAETVNFRKKTSDVPGESGVSISVLESSARLKDICGTPYLQNQGILCTKDTFQFSPLLGDLPWEVYEKDVVGVVPSGYIRGSLFRNNYLYLIIDYNNSPNEADTFINNFKFLD